MGMKIGAIEAIPIEQPANEALAKEGPIVKSIEDVVAALIMRVDDLTNKVNELIQGHNDTQAKIEPQRNIVEQTGNVKQVTVYGGKV
jgi:hypothetical protein